jgi:hypothetical protein
MEGSFYRKEIIKDTQSLAMRQYKRTDFASLQFRSDRPNVLKMVAGEILEAIINDRNDSGSHQL